ncbi:GSCFA domain-containing protein [Ascidiimonas aurantiaca]|uniref:GSCFA domain-containing protein n=1 Tax=Ascidiimonas aurantiaca TaxID=1685432 RepID=UPI0030ED0036
MKLLTEWPLQPQSPGIDYTSSLFLMGSCFTENIGDKLSYYQFPVIQNPFGIVFQPEAIEKLINRIVHRIYFTSEDIFFHNERWQSFEVHSKLNATSSEILLENLNTRIEASHKNLRHATHVILTMGTSWVYEHKETGKRVANCHKVPQNQFTKELMPVADITRSLYEIENTLREIAPKSTLLLTVSPVRHLKDGFTENQLSKAHLITALHSFLAKHTNAYYFPAYELMIDSLRDYRFYEEDMVHPNAMAITYIWEKFCGQWVKKECEGTMREVAAIRKGQAHTFFNPNSQQAKSFEEKLQKKKDMLLKKYPFMTFL